MTLDREPIPSRGTITKWMCRYLQGTNETMALALAEDSLRDGSFAVVVAEVKVAD